jgi:dipeptidyl aminopeptidase/acylaminoacyl peptidase
MVVPRARCYSVGTIPITYTNAYSQNQYLASRGYIVLSVNYRLGIGYGHDFHRPANAGVQGASEYLDVKAVSRILAATAAG